MALPGVRTAMTPQQRGRLGKRLAEPTLAERATIYLLLAEVLSRMAKGPESPEAKKVRGAARCWGEGVVRGRGGATEKPGQQHLQLAVVCPERPCVPHMSPVAPPCACHMQAPAPLHPVPPRPHPLQYIQDAIREFEGTSEEVWRRLPGGG